MLSKKNLLWEMLIEQIAKLWKRVPTGLICTFNGDYFHNMTKQKSLRNIVVRIILLFIAKILQEAMFLTSTYLG